MPNLERQLGIVKDVILPIDINMRYDLYFMDRRVAIVCLGRAGRFEVDGSGGSLGAFGVPPTSSMSIEKRRQDTLTAEEEIAKMPLADLLRLSKKSCFYTYDEIEKVKLIGGKKPRFIILSEDCESKLLLTPEQFERLSTFLPTIEGLVDKLWVFDKWKTLMEQKK